MALRVGHSYTATTALLSQPPHEAWIEEARIAALGIVGSSQPAPVNEAAQQEAEKEAATREALEACAIAEAEIQANVVQLMQQEMASGEKDPYAHAALDSTAAAVKALHDLALSGGITSRAQVEAFTAAVKASVEASCNVASGAADTVKAAGFKDTLEHKQYTFERIQAAAIELSHKTDELIQSMFSENNEIDRFFEDSSYLTTEEKESYERTRRANAEELARLTAERDRHAVGSAEWVELQEQVIEVMQDQVDAKKDNRDIITARGGSSAAIEAPLETEQSGVDALERELDAIRNQNLKLSPEEIDTLSQAQVDIYNGFGGNEESKAVAYFNTRTEQRDPKTAEELAANVVFDSNAYSFTSNSSEYEHVDYGNELLEDEPSEATTNFMAMLNQGTQTTTTEASTDFLALAEQSQNTENNGKSAEKNTISEATDVAEVNMQRDLPKILPSQAQQIT